MPNWVTTNWQVTLPTNKVKRFLNYFLRSDDVDKLKGRFLYRTFIDKCSINITPTGKDTSFITFVSDSAWTLESIINEHEEDEGGYKRCITLEELCRECDVIDLKAVGDEGGEGFRETVLYDDVSGLSYQSEDITPWFCDSCNTYGFWEDYEENIDRSVCPECNHKFEDEEV